MLTIRLEKLAYIIEKAREFDAEVPSDAEEGSNAADDAEREILLDTPDNPTTQELRDAIDGLNIDEREELLALVWLGRGDYNAENWSEALQLARQTQTATETAYLLGTLAVLVTLPSTEATGLQGILQAIQSGGRRVGLVAWAPVAAALVALGGLGQVASWFGGCARLPWRRPRREAPRRARCRRRRGALVCRRSQRSIPIHRPLCGPGRRRGL